MSVSVKGSQKCCKEVSVIYVMKDSSCRTRMRLSEGSPAPAGLPVSRCLGRWRKSARMIGLVSTMHACAGVCDTFQ